MEKVLTISITQSFNRSIVVSYCIKQKQLVSNTSLVVSAVLTHSKRPAIIAIIIVTVLEVISSCIRATDVMVVAILVANLSV